MTRLREAMAQAVKASEAIKTFEAAGSPVAYMNAPEFSKFMTERQRTLDRGGQEDRQGGVGNTRFLEASRFLVRANRSRAAFICKRSWSRCAEFRAHSLGSERDPDMRMHRIILGVVVAIGGAQAVSGQEYRGTWEQQQACTGDVWRLCGAQIPDVSRIVACLQRNTPNLSRGCRAVFESGNGVAQQQGPPPPRDRDWFTQQPGRGAPQRPPPGYYDDDE